MSTTRRAALALAAVLALAACGGTDETAADPTSSTESPVEQSTADPTPDDSGPEPPDTRPDARGSALTGTVAAVTGDVVQVQSADMQTGVTLTEAEVSERVAGSLADVTVGSCVTALSGPDAAAEGTDAVTSVTVTEPVDGGCTGFGGSPGGLPEGGFPGGERPDGDAPEGGFDPDDLPSDLPTDGMPEEFDPEGMPGGELPDGGFPDGGFGGASGLVTAVSGTTITLEDGTTLTVDETTTYTVTVAADAGAVVVGRCVSVQGEADDRGRVVAETVTVWDAGEEGCVVRGTTGGRPGGPGTSDEERTDG